VNVSRRRHFSTLAALGMTALGARPARAVERVIYGGQVRLVLPTSTASLDPHDPEDLTAALLGPNVFEPLFARSASGQPYPTLADGLPTVEGGRILVRLRPELTSARGRALTSTSVVASLVRARRALPLLAELGTPRAEGQLGFSLPSGDPHLVAQRLSLAATAIVPGDFRPESPQGSGAFAVTQVGRELTLKRNPNASRGGALLARVDVVRAELSDCLRAFEGGTSDLGWLGNGLHQPRAGAVPFQLQVLGWVVVLGGKGLGKLRAPGVLQAALDATKSRALDSLGYQRAPTASSLDFPGRDLIVACPDDCPQLAATATALGEAWSSSRSRVTVEREGRADLAARRRSGDFDVMLTFIATLEQTARDVHAALLVAEGVSVPAQFIAETPMRLARRLNLGVLGALAPHGATSSAWGQLGSAAHLDLGGVERRR